MKNQYNTFVRNIFLLLVILLLPLSVSAQEQPSGSVTNMEETGMWFGAYLKVRFSERFGYYGEHHWRVRNDIDDVWSFYGRPRQLYNRAGLNIFFNDYFEAVIGPTLVLNFTQSPATKNLIKSVMSPESGINGC
ncbi:hypothetical protein [Persicobacter sp. CCB-QB2]|uniref:hypothetical protein n=1 Tax=Persicobacter sp. CCB-QB2 TaxID=1561025 RepID=UPI0012FC87E8|nr:hypothetical protein [Persicobacter sp. CCB-QB2]